MKREIKFRAWNNKRMIYPNTDKNLINVDGFDFTFTSDGGWFVSSSEQN